MIMKTRKGFTLIELMVMLAILAIVMSVGVPQLSIFLKGSSMVANTNELIAGLHVARSSAIKAGGRVTMCKSTNADTATPTCATGSEGWEDGWIVYIEGTGAGNTIGTFDATDGPLLRLNTGAEGNGTTINTADTNLKMFVSFTSRGLPTNASGSSVSGTFMVCDDRGLTNASSNVVANGVILSATGRARASKDAVKIGVCP